MYTLLAIVDNTVVDTTTYDTLQEMRDYQAEHWVPGAWATFGSETKADKPEHMVEDETIQILVWPDGSWVEATDHNETECSWRGDDYMTRDVPLMEPDAIDQFALDLADGMSMSILDNMHI